VNRFANRLNIPVVVCRVDGVLTWCASQAIIMSRKRSTIPSTDKSYKPNAKYKYLQHASNELWNTGMNCLWLIVRITVAHRLSCPIFRQVCRRFQFISFVETFADIIVTIFLCNMCIQSRGTVTMRRPIVGDVDAIMLSCLADKEKISIHCRYFTKRHLFYQLSTGSYPNHPRK
jgi:hypothetical protein